MGLYERLRAFKNWCPEPSTPLSSKLKQFFISPKLAGTGVRNKWGYVPIAGGFGLIAAGLVTFIIHVVLNGELSGTAAAYAQRSDFWFYWAPMITVFLIAGAFAAVIGVFVLKRVTNRWFYALIAGAFILIAFDSYFFVFNWAKDFINIIGIENFYPLSATYFFSGLMAAVFMVALAMVLGLKVRNKWGIITAVGGSVLILLAVFLIVLDAAATIAIDPVFSLGLRDFRWYFFWQNFVPVIPFSLLIGGFLEFIGIYLIRMEKSGEA